MTIFVGANSLPPLTSEADVHIVENGERNQQHVTLEAQYARVSPVIFISWLKL